MVGATKVSSITSPLKLTIDTRLEMSTGEMTAQEVEGQRHIREHRGGPAWSHSYIGAGERDDLVITRDRVFCLHLEKLTGDPNLLCVPGRYMCGEYTPSRFDRELTSKALFVLR